MQGELRNPRFRQWAPIGNQGKSRASDQQRVHLFSRKEPCRSAPLSAKAYEFFWLSTGDRVSCFQHSQYREHPTYRAMMPEPLLDIHPQAAARLGIGNGEAVALSTRSGALDVRVNLASDVRSDCLRLTHGWTEANANTLTDADCFDPISGFPWMRALPARVGKNEADSYLSFVWKREGHRFSPIEQENFIGHYCNLTSREF